ncbi:hypothetical protein Golax_025591 [Gossypium laxum]|uniref:Uncharacterized protein n=1 Tax=Gossypium laxum TaxID=34288 RepID=A0A7J9B0W1_9ROSI|nr:hypothetical protein [Gossypium laxum]
MSGSEIAKKISAYTTELAISKVRTLTLHSSGNLQQLYKRDGPPFILTQPMTAWDSDQPQEIEFIFVPKEQNFYAHTIAKESLRSGESFYLEKEIPEAVRRTVENLWPYPPD